MFDVTCMDKYGNTVTNLTQWDLNQTLYIEEHGFTVAPQFHFCNKNREKALVVQSAINDGVLEVVVPNILLVEPYTITTYVYLSEDDSGKTVEYVQIPVRQRPQPDSFEYEDNVVIVDVKELADEIRTLNASISTAEEKRVEAEEQREANELVRQSQETERQTTTATAISNAEVATSEANAATQNANTATQDAIEATDKANQATQSANEAATNAESATVLTNTAIENANKATENADIATTNANEAAQNAVSATADIRNLEEEIEDAEAQRVSEEQSRQSQEATRQSQEEIRQTNTTTAITNAEKATDRANLAAEACEGIIEGTGLISSTEKGAAGGVATLDENTLIPVEQLPDIDAKTLDGHEAEYFVAKDGSVPVDRLLTIGASETDKYVALLLKNLNRSLEFGITQAGAIQLHDATNKKNIFTSGADGTNTFNGVASGNLPLTGGTVNGALIASATENNTSRVRAMNANRSIDLIAGSAYAGLYEPKSATWISYIDDNGNIIHNGTASGNLPLTGGTLTGNLYFKKVENGQGFVYKDHNASNDYGMVLRDDDVSGNSVKMLLSAASNTIRFRNTSGTYNDILHTGNYTDYATPENIGAVPTTLTADTSVIVPYDNELRIRTEYGVAGSGAYFDSYFKQTKVNFVGNTFEISPGSVTSYGTMTINNNLSVSGTTSFASIPKVAGSAVLTATTSAKVSIGTTAPSDTTSLWIDTSE